MAWEWRSFSGFSGSASDSHMTKDKSLNLPLPCFYCMQNRADNNTSLLLPLEGYSENWRDAILEVISAPKNWALSTEAVLFSVLQLLFFSMKGNIVRPCWQEGEAVAMC